MLQPWAETTAVIDVNAHAELNASGTVARAPFSGIVRAGSLRIEAPQYGLFFIDGRLNARLVDGALELDELSFAGGTGRFTASGRLAAAGDVPDVQNAAATITWRAEKFRGSIAGPPTRSSAAGTPRSRPQGFARRQADRR